MSYLQSWINRLRSDSRLIVSAASQAQKAADYILARTATDSEADTKISFPNLPEDNESLKVMLCSLLRERDRQQQRAEEQTQKAQEQAKRADNLHVENLRLQVELARYKKWYYGPRADRLPSSGNLAQVLLDFAEELERKPIHANDVPPQAEPEYELRRVKRRKGRRHLANFENLPVTTQVYELSAEERACPCCGVERKEIGAEESWQIEYLPGRFERIQHVRKKYACAKCEGAGESPRIETAAKAEEAWPDRGCWPTS